MPDLITAALASQPSGKDPVPANLQKSAVCLQDMQLLGMLWPSVPAGTLFVSNGGVYGYEFRDSVSKNKFYIPIRNDRFC